MKKSIIALTAAIAISAPTMASNDNKIPAVGVLAHTVLSQAEIAKLKHFEINKALSIERAASILDAASSKLTIINQSSEDKLTATSISSEPIRKKIQKTYAVSDLLSDGILWAGEVLTKTERNPFINELTEKRDDLKLQIGKAENLKIDAEKQINLLVIEAQRDRQIEIDTNILENKKLLDARESELKSIIQNKLLLGSFEINLYYLTAEFKPQQDDFELISRILKSVSGLQDAHVDIIGRADPRGNLKYNERLAKQRAEYIGDIAKEAGINKERVKINSYVTNGEVQKNRELHFFDRNTTITVYKK